MDVAGHRAEAERLLERAEALLEDQEPSAGMLLAVSRAHARLAALPEPRCLEIDGLGQRCERAPHDDDRHSIPPDRDVARLGAAVRQSVEAREPITVYGTRYVPAPDGPAGRGLIPDALFRLLLDLTMQADPAPWSIPEDEQLKHYLDEEAAARGYDGGWVVAYHEHPPRRARLIDDEPDPDAPRCAHQWERGRICGLTLDQHSAPNDHLFDGPR